MGVSLNIAILTISDTRTPDNDTSGQYLAKAAKEAGHSVSDQAIIADDIYQVRARVSRWIADNTIQVIISTGGTGFAKRDVTPEALIPLFDKTIDGFGELFRAQSFDVIGTSTIQSRAIAGLANQTIIFCLPGSTGACKDGWKIIQPQLDSEHKPCNFTGILKHY